jgi:ElaB/YqjD/DUF883 family membrane-anchored ribosome-binding protein
MDANNRESRAEATSSESTSAAASRVRRNLADKAGDAKQSLNELGRKAADRFDSSRRSTGSALEWTATSLHSRADQISDFTHSAADRIQGAADYVRETDIEGIFDDVREAVCRYPGRSLAIAAAAGFLIARGLRRIGQ